jgi:serine protease AprX
MRVAWGVSWEDSKKARLLGMMLAPVMLLSLATPSQRVAMMRELSDSTSRMVSVIVQEVDGNANAEELVTSLGGKVELQLDVINGFAAEIPKANLQQLRQSPEVRAVTRNYPLYVQSADGGLVGDAVDTVTGAVTTVTDAVTTDTTTTTPSSGTTEPAPSDSGTPTTTPTTEPSPTPTVQPSPTPTAEPAPTVTGSLFDLAKTTGARALWRDGYCGQGVDVALIDTGVVPVNGLTYPGKIVNGPDFSFESDFESVRYLDTNGHGTHMAGIIAGRDDAASRIKFEDEQNFLGIAPCSRIVNIKVGNASGATDVSQVLAAIGWVIQHRRDASMGLNIKVLNLSFGTDGTQDYKLDPLTYAVERAWHSGVTVVVAAGNQQFGSTALNNPAYDPYVIAVGANDTKGTNDVGDDEIPSWSARGDNKRNPDVVAPGKSVISLRSPGSFIDENYGSTGIFRERYFKGSGTSQAAAAVSGAAALIYSQRPTITPDQMKALLMMSARRLKNADATAQGAGMIELQRANRYPTPTTAVQAHPPATGLGSLALSRGSMKLTLPDGTELTGEMDALGGAYDPTSFVRWMGAGWSGAGWSGAGWSGKSWSGAGWSGAGWSGAGWSAAGWSGAGWSGAGWSGAGWSGAGWSGKSWSGAGWSGKSWSGAGWSGAGWSGAGWSGAGWSGAGWSGAGWSGAGWS